MHFGRLSHAEKAECHRKAILRGLQKTGAKNSTILGIDALVAQYGYEVRMAERHRARYKEG
jgi:hypothetical protein